MKYQVKL